MSSKNRYDGLDAEVVTLARRKAWSLVGYCGFTRNDTEDLEQMLVVHALADLPGHDPTVCRREAFIQRSLTDCVSELVRRARAQKRGPDWKRQGLGEALPGSFLALANNLALRQFHEQRQFKELAEELERLELTDEEAQLCELLRCTSLVAAAGALGLTRWRARKLAASVARKLRRKISEDFPPTQNATSGEPI